MPYTYISSVDFINRLILLFSGFLLLFSCNAPDSTSRRDTSTPGTDTLARTDTATENQIEKNLKTIPKDLKPVFGYRFVITGDFDGDGKKERLIEHYCSGLDGEETNKFYDSLPDYDQLVALAVQKKPHAFVLSDNPRMDTLLIGSGGQILGLSYLKNEGDLNGDGTDEVSYVVNWADWSNCNTWHIVTYRHQKWVELYSFSIWDSQLPDLPETTSQYGLFGIRNKIVDAENDTLNRRLEEELKAFKGLVRKIRTNKIRVEYKNEEAMLDTGVVDLRSIR